MLVHPSVPARTLRELIALAQARPGELNYGSAGPAQVSHLNGELLKILARVDLVAVPYNYHRPMKPDEYPRRVDEWFEKTGQKP